MTTSRTNSRREFLRKAGTAGILAAALPNIVIKAAAPQTTGSSDITADGWTFLFQGDSITDGNRGRNKNPNHIMGHGYAFSIASRVMADFPEKNLHFITEASVAIK